MSLKGEVASEIREMRFREAEEHVKGRWGEFVLEAINERVTREQQALKAELGKTKIAVFE